MSFKSNSSTDGNLVTTRETICNPYFLTSNIELKEETISRAINQALTKIDAGLQVFKTQFPAPSSVAGVYPAIDNIEWTNGFWTGQLWLAYELTGAQRYLDAALQQVDSFAERIEQRINVDHHDLGFLYSLSCVAGYKITGNQKARSAALSAAECLLERYLPVAGIVQAWGDLKDPEEAGRMIIDCNLNLPLLYWASEETGDNKFRIAADSHIQNAMQYLIRPDASTFHTYFMDIVTGAPRKGTTHQGFSDSSCWARGQAWGISGFPLVYAHNPDPQLIAQACRLANYFINRLPEDLVCYWDLIFTQGDEPRDSSAAATAVCGLLELLRHLPNTDQDRAQYQKATKTIMAQLIQHYTTHTNDKGTGLLNQAVYHKPKNIGVNESCIWGDYFYLEALVRLTKNWRSYW